MNPVNTNDTEQGRSRGKISSEGDGEAMTKIISEIRIEPHKTQVWEVLSDLGSVSAWSPAIAKSFYTSEAKEGLEASRRCDFPGVYVEERTTAWKRGEGFTLENNEGTVPFASAFGTYSLRGDGHGASVAFRLEYELKKDTSADPQEVERKNRDELIPLTPANLKRYQETGEPMAAPATS